MLNYFIPAFKTAFFEQEIVSKKPLPYLGNDPCDIQTKTPPECPSGVAGHRPVGRRPPKRVSGRQLNSRDPIPMGEAKSLSPDIISSIFSFYGSRYRQTRFGYKNPHHPAIGSFCKYPHFRNPILFQPPDRNAAQIRCDVRPHGALL